MALTSQRFFPSMRLTKRKEFEIIEGTKKMCRFYLYPNIWKWYKTLSYTI